MDTAGDGLCRLARSTKRTPICGSRVAMLRAEIQKLRNSTLAKNAGWMLVGQGLGFVLQAGYFILIARLLGTSEYGVYAGAFALVAIVGTYTTLGSGTLFLRYVSADKTKFSIYWGN